MNQPALLTAILCLILCNDRAYCQWTKLTSGTPRDLSAIYFIDSANGFCVGGNNASMLPGNGIILKTTDGGANWNTSYEDSTVTFREIAVNNDTITVPGTDKFGQNIVLQSNDKGNTWVSDTVNFPMQYPQYIQNKLYFINAGDEKLECITSGNHQQFLHKMIRFAVNTKVELYAICYSSTPGYEFMFAKSTDLGASWDTSLVNFATITSNSLTGSSLWAFGDTVVFLATYPSAIAYSYDKGKTWQDTTVFFETWNACLASAEIMTSGFFKKITKSTDAGKTHVVQDSITDRAANLFFLNEQLGFLCGENGMIYKTTNGGGATSVQQFKSPGIDIAVYPNPATTHVNIASMIKLKNAQLNIYNAAGQVVSNTEHLSGNTVRIGFNLAEGIYTYRLTEKGNILSKGRMIIHGRN